MKWQIVSQAWTSNGERSQTCAGFRDIARSNIGRSKSSAANGYDESIRYCGVHALQTPLSCSLAASSTPTDQPQRRSSEQTNSTGSVVHRRVVGWLNEDVTVVQRLKLDDKSSLVVVPWSDTKIDISTTITF